MEEESGIITEVATTPANATDGSQLQPLLKEQEKVHSLTPQELTADKAYDWGRKPGIAWLQEEHRRQYRSNQAGKPPNR